MRSNSHIWQIYLPVNKYPNKRNKEREPRKGHCIRSHPGWHCVKRRAVTTATRTSRLYEHSFIYLWPDSRKDAWSVFSGCHVTTEVFILNQIDFFSSNQRELLSHGWGRGRAAVWTRRWFQQLQSKLLSPGKVSICLLQRFLQTYSLSACWCHHHKNIRWTVAHIIIF